MDRVATAPRPTWNLPTLLRISSIGFAERILLPPPLPTERLFWGGGPTLV